MKGIYPNGISFYVDVGIDAGGGVTGFKFNLSLFNDRVAGNQCNILVAITIFISREFLE